MTSWLKKSDLSAALTGAIFKYGFPGYHGSMGMVAGQSAIISIVSRLVSSQVPLSLLNGEQKNIIVVALLGAVVGMYGGSKNPLQSSIGQTAIDVLGMELLNILNMPDGDLLAPAVIGPAPANGR